MYYFVFVLYSWTEVSNVSWLLQQGENLDQVNHTQDIQPHSPCLMSPTD